MVFSEAFFSRSDCRNCKLVLSTGPRGGKTFLSAILLPLGARMVLAVDRLQAVEGDVSVELRGRYIGMAEQGLDVAQVGTVLHHVGSAPVSQHVRAGLARSSRCCGAYQLPDPLAR